MGWFTREWLVKSDGSYEDVLDGRPFSTQFSHSRFLTPYVANQMGYKGRYVVFVDCDFVFKRNINDLISYVDNHPEEHPVWCVKHDFSVKEDIKMDGQKQQDYPCKLWSSLMVFDLKAMASALVNPKTLAKYTNQISGRSLHTFTWCDEFHYDVGPLPEAWNFIPEHSEPRVRYEDICALHYTHGVPTMRDVSYSRDYYNVLKEVDKWDLIQPGRVGPF